MDSYLTIIAIVLTPAVIGLMVAILFKIWRRYEKSKADREPAMPLGDPEFCEECGYELRSGHDVCPECGTRVPTPEERNAPRGAKLDPRALRELWPLDAIEPRRPSPDETPFLLHTTENQSEADLLTQHLSCRGVMAELKTDSITTHARTVSEKVYYLVIVPSGDKELSESIIKQFRWRQRASVTSGKG